MSIQEEYLIFEGYRLPRPAEELRLKARKFNAAEIVPLEANLPYDAEFLDKAEYDRLSKKAKAQGLWCPEVPKQFGGGGVGCFGMCLVSEEWSQHRAGIYHPGYGAYGYPPIEAIWGGTKEQIEKYGIPAVKQGYRTFWAATESGPGSDAASCETTARKEGDYYILNGTKLWVSAAYESPWGLVTARTSADKYQGISAFIVETNMPGVTLVEMPTGRSSYKSPRMILNNVKVHKDNLLGGGEGKGFGAAMRYFNMSRPYYSAIHVGVATAANRLAKEYSKKRVIFGGPLSEKQSIQSMLVDSEVEIRSTRWLVWESAWKTDLEEDARIETAMAKIYSAEMLCRVVDRAIQVYGGYGVTKEDLPLERWYREARFRRIGRGATEALKFNTIARYLLAQS